jgi:osmotically-inducible protein OsmY
MPSSKLVVLALGAIFGLSAIPAASFAQLPDTEVVGGGSNASSNQAPNQGPNQPAAKEITHSSVNYDKNAALYVGHHHYNSDAERAADDLIITEVKSELADDGISKGYPVEVDADHGTVTLNGVVASRDDAKAAAEDAADVQGVVKVRNLLKPR